jgi:hypothetical protein
VRRSPTWIGAVDARAVGRLTWIRAAHPRAHQGARRRFLVDPGYATVSPSIETATYAGIARALWRMRVGQRADLVSRADVVRWEPLGQREGIGTEDTIVDVMSATKLDGRALRPLLNAQRRGACAVIATASGLFDSTAEVPVIPAWVVALAAEVADALLGGQRELAPAG